MSRRVNTQFSVAVHMLAVLAAAGPGRHLKSPALAAGPGSNPSYVRWLLGHLRTAGLVTSRNGSYGGTMLARPPAEISLADVWHAVNADSPLIHVHPAVANDSITAAVRSTLQRVEDTASAQLLADLSAISIADVLAQS